MERVCNSAVARLEKIHYVQYKKAGKLIKKGLDGGFSSGIFKILVQVCKTSVSIKQINAETTENTQDLCLKGKKTS